MPRNDLVERGPAPELVKRIDRIVVFRPFTRTVMRELLRKELADVLQRRGLRTRPWAVEWDESALEFVVGSSSAVPKRDIVDLDTELILAVLAGCAPSHRVV